MVFVANFFAIMDRCLMDVCQLVLSALRTHCRDVRIDDISDITWDDAALIRSCLVRLEHGDRAAWSVFTDRLQGNLDFAAAVHLIMEESGFVQLDVSLNQLIMGSLPSGTKKFVTDDEERFLRALDQGRRRYELTPEPEPPTDKGLTEIMYIEAKPGLHGPARIGRIRFSKSGRTLYYDGLEFQSLKGAGYKANYREVHSGERYWISKCRKDGHDTLYPGIVHIDEDVRELYWTMIRECPEMKDQTSFRSEGKYAKRRPT